MHTLRHPIPGRSRKIAFYSGRIILTYQSQALCQDGHAKPSTASNNMIHRSFCVGGNEQYGGPTSQSMFYTDQTISLGMPDIIYSIVLSVDVAFRKSDVMND